MPSYKVKPGHTYFDCDTSRLYQAGEIVTYDNKPPFKEPGENLEETKDPPPKTELDE